MDAPSFEVTLLPGARTLLELHARELPQRDELCGAFCGALALGAAGLEEHDGAPLDQDAVAVAAGSVLAEIPDTASLPLGERGRRDYRVSLPLTDDSALAGTTAPGLVRAIAQLAGLELAAIPYAGPWTDAALDGLFELAGGLSQPVTLVANHATAHLWGTHPRVDQLLDYLIDGKLDGPPPDWRVGHFACIVGRARGPVGTLYAVADTYPALGSAGVHLQPRERLVSALERRGDPTDGGIIVVVATADASALRAGAQALGLSERAWDNGTVTAEMLR